MSNKVMQEFNFISKYSHFIPETNKKESWDESVSRIYNMHEVYYKDVMTPELKKLIDYSKQAEIDRKILSAQRVRQFAGVGILKNHAKLYNCASTYLDRVDFFSEIMWTLLSGAGAGFSIQKKHIKKLPQATPIRKEIKFHYKIEDTIEGWAHAIGYLVNSYLEDKDSKYHLAYGTNVIMDYSLIRPKGALIAGQFKAPGSDGLRNSIEKIREILENAVGDNKKKRALRSIELYDITMWIADAVLSGGVRRSATICLFSIDDLEMRKAKTGNWFSENPQRRLSNNSAVLVRGKATKEQFMEIFNSIKEFGEPGFVMTPDEDITYNPCVEIGKRPQTEDGKSGWQFCNLTEGNGGYCDTEEKFYEVCKASAIVGTLQAGYHEFEFLGSITEEIVKREALLGVSMTGWMMNPDVLFDEEILRKGARIVKEWNAIVADLIGINHAARTTCTKPAGNSSILLATSSGIHGEHSLRYIRRIQVNKDEIAGQEYGKLNPFALEQSVWKHTDNVVSFAIKSNGKAKYKKELIGLKQLEYVKKAQKYWVEEGTREELCVDPKTRHNISNTIQVDKDGWDEVAEYVWKNRKIFAGISFLSSSGDLDYQQAPFTAVLTPEELVKEYGSAVPLASGLIVDGLKCFDDNLWDACDVGLGFKKIVFDKDTILQEISDNIDENFEFRREIEGVMVTDINACISNSRNQYNEKMDWVRRFKKFAKNYMDGDLKKTSYCLKHISLWHSWCKLRNESEEVNWKEVDFSDDYIPTTSSNVATACAGGACEVNY